MAEQPTASAAGSKEGPGVLLRTLSKGDGVRFAKKGDLCLVRTQNKKRKIITDFEKRMGPLYSCRNVHSNFFRTLRVHVNLSRSV